MDVRFNLGGPLGAVRVGIWHITGPHHPFSPVNKLGICHPPKIKKCLWESLFWERKFPVFLFPSHSRSDPRGMHKSTCIGWIEVTMPPAKIENWICIPKGISKERKSFREFFVFWGLSRPKKDGRRGWQKKQKSSQNDQNTPGTRKQPRVMLKSASGHWCWVKWRTNSWRRRNRWPSNNTHETVHQARFYCVIIKVKMWRYVWEGVMIFGFVYLKTLILERLKHLKQASIFFANTFSDSLAIRKKMSHFFS